MSRATPLPDKLLRNSASRKKKAVEVSPAGPPLALRGPQAVTVLCGFQDLQLDHVFGYRGSDCRNNLHYLNDDADIVFHTAAAAIVQNLSSGL